MLNIFKYLGKHKLAVFLVLLLLVVQAFCDLSLPAYTSDIVDVGIQQGGIESVTPEQIRPETLENLELFMTEDNIAIIENAYALNSSGNMELIADKEEIESLNDIFSIPMLMMSQISSNKEYDLDSIKAALSSGQMTKDQLLDMADSAIRSMGTLSESITGQMALLFVKDEYKAMGLDLGKIQTNYLWETGLKMLALTIVSISAAVVVGLIASRVAAKIGLNLREGVFTKVLSFSSAELDKFSTASLITRSTNDIQQIQMVLVMLLRMVLYAPIIGIGGVIKVASTKTGMGWIIAVAVGVLMTIIAVLLVVAMPKFKKMQSLVDRLNLVSREILSGLPVIRAFSREKHEEARFGAANNDLMKTQLFTNRTMAFMFPTMMLIMNGISVMIVWFGAKGIDLGQLQVGDMMAFITYTMQIIIAFMMLTMISIMLPRAGVAATRIDEVLLTEPVLKDKDRVIDARLEDIKGIINFDDVSFRYPGAENNALNHISFCAAPGQTTAIIGSTGSGKSTLANLIPRFYDVNSGSITIDGIDIRDLSQKKLRSLLGYVPQQGILFTGDIESNLKFADNALSDDAMFEAAQIAQASGFIEELPEKYQSPIAQGGSNVSGGQKQRLSIARAIARNPKIFLFDDSFSALDYKTDIVLRRALSEKLGSTTVIIIAQRISTILHADRIIVLSDGQIVGSGTHEELLKSCETYQEIARSQLSNKELGEDGE